MKSLLFVLLVLIPLVAYAQAEQSGIADGVITHQDLFNSTAADDSVACYRIPVLVTVPNGDLVAAIDERVPSCADLRGSEDINIVMRRSSDRGETWSEMETVVDFPHGQSASDPSMIVDTETGDVFLFYNFMDLEEEPDVYYLHVLKSSDNGQTWSEPADITPQITKPAWHDDFKFITSGRGIQTRSGTLLHTLVNLDEGLHLFGSDDHGASWFLIDTPITPGDESKVVELNNSTWMINSRVNEAGMRWVHVSDDRGQTWTSRPDSVLIDPSVNGSIIRYTATADGDDRNRLLFANAASAEARENLTVRLSYDEGQAWSEGKTIYAGGAAYPSMTVLDNGDIGVLFEKDDYTENVFVRFSLEWLTDGADKLEENP
ncbi:MAG: sialidase family protein [Rhodothermales bacterium]